MQVDQYETISVERNGAVDTLGLDRPDARNGLQRQWSQSCGTILTTCWKMIDSSGPDGRTRWRFVRA